MRTPSHFDVNLIAGAALRLAAWCLVQGVKIVAALVAVGVLCALGSVWP